MSAVFGKVPSWWFKALEKKPSAYSAIAVATYISSCVNSKLGFAWPSIEDIAAGVGFIKPRTVTRVLPILVEAGIIRQQRRQRANSKYFVNLDPPTSGKSNLDSPTGALDSPPIGDSKATLDPPTAGHLDPPTSGVTVLDDLLDNTATYGKEENQENDRRAQIVAKLELLAGDWDRGQIDRILNVDVGLAAEWANAKPVAFQGVNCIPAWIESAVKAGRRPRSSESRTQTSEIPEFCGTFEEGLFEALGPACRVTDFVKGGKAEIQALKALATIDELRDLISFSQSSACVNTACERPRAAGTLLHILPELRSRYAEYNLLFGGAYEPAVYGRAS